MPTADLFAGLQEWMQPYARGAYTDFYNYTGIYPTITSVYRTFDQQAFLWANRVANSNPVEFPGDSAHQYGLAFDSTVPSGYQEIWNWFRREYGWDVPADDLVHSQLWSWRDYVPEGYRLPGFGHGGTS